MIRKKYTEPTWNDITYIVTTTAKLQSSSSIPLSKKLPPYTVQTLVSFSVNNRSVGRSYFPTSLSYSLDFLCSRTVKSFSLRAWCMFYDKLCIMLCYRSIGWSYFSASLCYLVDFLYSRTMKSFSLHVWRMFYDKLWIILSVFDDDRYTVKCSYFNHHVSN